jgi:hypothetical protein
MADDGDLYDLSPSTAPIAPPEQKPAPVLAYQRPGSAAVTNIEPIIEGRPIKDFWLPIGFLGFGTAGVFIHAFAIAPHVDTFYVAVRSLGFDLAWNVVLMLIGIVIAAKMLDIGFGRAEQAVLKLAALALGPAGLAGIIAALIGGVSGEVAGFFISMPLYWWLFSYLFDLDFQEAFISLLLISILKIAAAILWALLVD